MGEWPVWVIGAGRRQPDKRKMTRKLWAGLDVGVETTRVCVINDRGEVLHESTCPTTLGSVHERISWLRRRRHAKVSLEAGTGAALARGLRSRGYSVDLYETRQLSKFLRARRNKTDAGDAIGIAEAGRIGATIVSKVHLKNLECQFLQSRLVMRRHLIRQRVATTNLLCRQLELFGGRIPGATTTGQFRAELENQLRQIFGRASNPFTSELLFLLDRCDTLRTHEKLVDQGLRRTALELEVCRRFMEIPGIGPICALTFYAAVGDPHRFGNSSQVGSYLGLTPRVRQSGMSRRIGRISKMGNRGARSVLVGAGTLFMRWSSEDADLKKWAIRIEERRGRKKARVALARKLAVIMIAMWKNGETYRPSMNG
jgi:transposase